MYDAGIKFNIILGGDALRFQSSAISDAFGFAHRRVEFLHVKVGLWLMLEKCLLLCVEHCCVGLDRLCDAVSLTIGWKVFWFVLSLGGLRIL